MAEKVEEEEVKEKVKRRERSRGRWRSGLADGGRVKKGGSARESERSIRTLATFFVVGTGNSGRKRKRDRDTGSTCVRT